MERAEQDLGTKLDWVAIDHFNTGHPHSHVIVRGKDDLGKDLVIAREYLTQGFRERAAELVSIDLGPRTQAEILRSQLNEIGQERFTDLDRRLVKAMGEDGLVRAVHYDGVEQSLRAGRLQTLGRMGLAREVVPGAWKLDPQIEPTLRRMGETHDIIRTMQRAMRESRELRRVAAQLSKELGLTFTEAQPYDHIEGKVTRSVQLGDRKFALVERSREFTLLPWRPVLERAIGKQVSGIVREGGIDWTIGRSRGLNIGM